MSGSDDTNTTPKKKVKTGNGDLTVMLQGERVTSKSHEVQDVGTAVRGLMVLVYEAL